MTDAEFRSWLEAEVEGRRMTDAQRVDLLRQKDLFDKELGGIDDPRRDRFRFTIVGYVADNLLSSPEIHALLDGARAAFPDRMIYFEPIGFELA